MKIQNISPEELGKFTTEIVSTFINKEEPVHNLHYTYNMFQGRSYVQYFKGNKKFTLVLIVPHTVIPTIINEIHYSNFLVIDSSTVYFGNEKLEKYSTSDFNDDYFALSTVLSADSLENLHFSTYFSDIELGSYALILRTDNIQLLYNDMHSNTIKS